MSHMTLRQCIMNMNYHALPEELKHVITLYALDVHSDKRRALYTSIRLCKFVRLIDHVSMSTEARDTILETVKSGGTIDDFINDVFQAHTPSASGIFKLRIGPRVRLRIKLQRLRGRI